jgi:hypothetical protein
MLCLHRTPVRQQEKTSVTYDIREQEAEPNYFDDPAPTECDRCGELLGDEPRAEIVGFYDDGDPENGPHLATYLRTIHASCFREGDELA